MNDLEFFESLKQRAAASLMPIISDSEWSRLDGLAGRPLRFMGIVPAGPSKWAVPPQALRDGLKAVEALIMNRIKARLTS